MDIAVLRQRVLEVGVLGSEEMHFVPLSGGVSSDIYIIETPTSKFVLKQALPKLKVEADWKADIRRNLAEQDFNDYVAAFAPQNVPEILFGDRKNAFFIMPYYGFPYRNWKEALLAGERSSHATREAARLLAKIHTESYRDEIVREAFDHSALFLDLRVEPYLIFTGGRHPEWNKIFVEEAHRLMTHKETIIHGDFSPKNILVTKDKLLLLDHEVACLGDPAFDIAFLLNHLLLK